MPAHVYGNVSKVKVEAAEKIDDILSQIDVLYKKLPKLLGRQMYHSPTKVRQDMVMVGIFMQIAQKTNTEMNVMVG